MVVCIASRRYDTQHCLFVQKAAACMVRFWTNYRHAKHEKHFVSPTAHSGPRFGGLGRKGNMPFSDVHVNSMVHPRPAQRNYTVLQEYSTVRIAIAVITWPQERKVIELKYIHGQERCMYHVMSRHSYTKQSLFFKLRRCTHVYVVPGSSWS